MKYILIVIIHLAIGAYAYSERTVIITPSGTSNGIYEIEVNNEM